MSDAPAPTPADVTALVHAAVPAIGRLGVEVVELAPGLVRLRMPHDGNANHIGTMYAGSLFAIAELPGGLLPLAMPELAVVPILTRMEITFSAAVRSGDVTVDVAMDPAELRALADEAHTAGAADFDLDVEVKDSSGRIVVSSVGGYQLRPVRA